MISPLPPDFHRPRLPADPAALGIGLVGCGGVMRRWQLPHYLANGIRVVAATDPDPSALSAALDIAPGLTAYRDLASLLNDPRVRVVDIATLVRGRAELIIAALAAGKHVLAQKPLCLDEAELDRIRVAVQAPDAPTFAVNFNGRWAPQWRAASHLILDGAIGEVRAISHHLDLAMDWTRDVDRHGSPHFLFFDYMIHWIDISIVWLGHRRCYKVRSGALDHPAADGQIAQAGWLALEADGVVDAHIRAVTVGPRYSGHFFTVHGTKGTLRGAVDAPDAGDHLVLDRPGGRMLLDLEGEWFPDGFVGSMGDLLRAIEDCRPPEAGIDSASVTQRLVFAACRSVDMDGAGVEVTP